jgi:hypothetical protein
LRIALEAGAALPDIGERMLEVVGVIEEAVAPLGLHPVVVGGMAVYFWTHSDAFLTTDIDVVVPTTDAFSEVLFQLGFERQEGRHWYLPGTEVWLEAPSSYLDKGAVIQEAESPSGREVSVLSRVDVILSRLAEFQATGHAFVGEQVLVLLAGLPAEERPVLKSRAADARLASALKGMTVLAEEVSTGRRSPPDSGEWHELARLFLRAEYHPLQP